jgi:energy-coupling factor transporter transmembrane protein EcfT
MHKMTKRIEIAALIAALALIVLLYQMYPIEVGFAFVVTMTGAAVTGLGREAYVALRRKAVRS